MAKINLSAPWVEFYKKVESMFCEDPEIRVIYDEDANEVKLFVDNSSKADALAKLLPAEKAFGDVVMKITVVPSDGEDSPISLFERAFFGNPAFSYAEKTEGSFSATYIVFAKEVVQYYADNLGDPYGLKSTLFQDIAKDLFEEQNGVFFCTDAED